MITSPRIEAVKNGDLDAFRSLVDDHSTQIHAYFSSRLNDPSAVEDLTQETFIAAWQHIDRYEPIKEFGAWLTGIARNKLLNHFRSRKRRASALERLRYEVVTKTEEYLERVRGEHVRHQVSRLRGCIAELPEDTREMIEGCYLRGESVREVASRLSRTEDAVHAALYRARRRLRHAMQQTGADS